MLLFPLSSDPKASEMEKTKKPLQKSEAIAVTGQSSKMGPTEVNVLLDVIPLTVLLPGQPIPTKTKGLGNKKKAIGSNAD